MPQREIHLQINECSASSPGVIGSYYYFPTFGDMHLRGGFTVSFDESVSKILAKVLEFVFSISFYIHNILIVSKLRCTINFEILQLAKGR